jgi:hypothetical protein
MKNKIVLPFVATLFLVLFAGVGSAFAGWHDLTQPERNQAIVDEANSYNNGDYGDTCKRWVQLYVVWDVSN